MKKTTNRPNVVTKLKRNFILIVMGMMTILLLGSFLAINMSNQNYKENNINARLTEIANRDGLQPQFNGGNKPNIGQYDDSDFRIDAYVAVRISEEGEIFGITTGSITSVSVTKIQSLVDITLETGKATGEIQGWRFLLQEKSYGYILVYMDVSTQNQLENNLMMISGSILSLVWLAMLGLALFLSRWIAKPVEKAFATQTRFVADASHELKTPIAVINANLAVLESSGKKPNKWLGYIQAETSRMNGLVNSLLTLATMDDPSYRREDSTFMMDDLVESCVLPFESLLFESGIKLTVDCEKGISMTGDRDKMSQMIRILLENAAKHTKEGGTIDIELKKKGNKKILTVYNQGEPISAVDGAKIFERFYRTDFARDRDSGGYGLGLSIARTIVKLHKGKIYVDTTVRDIKSVFHITLLFKHLDLTGCFILCSFIDEDSKSYDLWSRIKYCFHRERIWYNK
jgi:two-component system, OmpR family, sensor histidine kinase CiaH